MTGEYDAPTLFLAELLSQLGYKAEMVGPSLIKSSFSGTQVLVKVDDNDTFQFLAAWQGFPNSFGLKEANDFNSSYRFGTVYLTDNSLRMQANFLFDPIKQGVKEEFQKAIHLFEGLISELLAKLHELWEEGVDTNTSYSKT